MDNLTNVATLLGLLSKLVFKVNQYVKSNERLVVQSHDHQLLHPRPRSEYDSAKCYRNLELAVSLK